MAAVAPVLQSTPLSVTWFVVVAAQLATVATSPRVVFAAGRDIPRFPAGLPCTRPTKGGRAARALECLDGLAACAWSATLLALLVLGPGAPRAVLAPHALLGVLLGALDELRLLAFAFHYWLLMLCFLAPSEAECAMGLVCVMGAVYFWAGLFKFNSTWRRATFPEILRQLLPDRALLLLAPHLAPLGATAALLELALGAAIWAAPFVGWPHDGLCIAVVSASMLTHLQILWAVSPARLNLPQLWPWNAAMPLFTYGALGAVSEAQVGALSGPADATTAPLAVLWTWTWRSLLLLFCAVLPATHLAGLSAFGRTWDANLCFNVWSGNQPVFTFVLASDAWHRRGPPWLRHARLVGTTGTYAAGRPLDPTCEGTIQVSVENAAEVELHWRFPPERHLYRRLCALLAEELAEPVKLVEELPPLRGAGHVVH